RTTEFRCLSPYPSPVPSELLDEAGVPLLDLEAVAVEVLGPEEAGRHGAGARGLHAVEELPHETVGDPLLPVALGDDDLLEVGRPTFVFDLVDDAADERALVVDGDEVLVLGPEAHVEARGEEEAVEARDLLGREGV